MQPEQISDEAGDPVTDNGKRVRKKRKRKRRKDENPEWEESNTRARRRESRKGQLTLVAGLLLFAGILAVVVFITRGGGGSTAAMEEPFEEPLPSLALPEVDLAASSPVPRDDARFVSDAEPVARFFLEAASVEELLEVVDRPELVAERIKRYFPDGSIEPLGLGEYNAFSQVKRLGPFGTLALRTGNHQIRQMTFREYPEALKVVWESWVGWSDTPWDEFIEERPAGPHVFRALVRDVEYYNFDFTDDREWQSYRLTSPDGDHTLYGYVERDSPAHAALRTVLDEGLDRVMVELQLPDDATARSQVIIKRVVSTDWVDPAHATEP